MAVKEIDLRRLVIKAFHMNEVEFGDALHNDNGTVSLPFRKI